MTSKILALQGCAYFKRSTYTCGQPSSLWAAWQKKLLVSRRPPSQAQAVTLLCLWHPCYPKNPDWTPDLGSHSVSLLQRSLAPVTSPNVSSTQTVLWNAVVFSQHFHPCFVPGLTLYLSLCANVLHKFHFVVLLTREPNRLDFTN